MVVSGFGPRTRSYMRVQEGSGGSRCWGGGHTRTEMDEMAPSLDARLSSERKAAETKFCLAYS